MIQKVKSRTDVVNSPLERENPRSSVRHRLTLEREKSRSSVDCTLPEVLQAMVPARAPNSPLERRDCRVKYWEMEKHARASKLPLERISNNEEPARALKLPLEREGQNLGITFRFQSATNLFQTCPSQPKTLIQRVKAKSDDDTKTSPRNQVRNTTIQ